MIWNTSRLVKFEMLGVFVNTFTAEDKNPVRDSENFSFAIKTQLS